jgi:hypothetical protein
LKRRSSNPIHPYRKPPVDERRMKEWIMNTSWSCTQKAYIVGPFFCLSEAEKAGLILRKCRRVGCDGTHTLLCKGCEYATDRGGQCELPVNQGGTTEIVYPSLSISDKDVFLFPAIKKKGRRNYGNL